jgi:putative transposase
MKKSRFTEEQIIASLRQVEAGASVKDVVRQMGVTESTFYIWKRKYAGLGVSELKKLKTQEDEIRRLKSIVADLMLDKQMLQDVIAKKL